MGVLNIKWCKSRIDDLINNKVINTEYIESNYNKYTEYIVNNYNKYNKRIYQKIVIPFFDNFENNNYYKKLYYIFFLYLGVQRKIIYYLHNIEYNWHIPNSKYGKINGTCKISDKKENIYGTYIFIDGNIQFINDNYMEYEFDKYIIPYHLQIKK